MIRSPKPYTTGVKDRRFAWLAVALVGAAALALLLSWLVPRVVGSAHSPTADAPLIDPETGLPIEPSDSAEAARRGELGLEPDAGAVAAPWLPTATVTRDASDPHGSLGGRIVSSEDARGIAGAELVFVHDGNATSVSSGDDGAFTLAASSAGRYVLSIATADGFLPYAPEWGHSAISFEARPTERIDGVLVQLSPEHTYEVEVVRDESTPVAGATIRLVGAGSDDRTMAPVQSEFVTDAEGLAQVRAWRGALLEARHPDHGVGRARMDQRSSREGRARIQMSAPSEAATSSETIAGVVLDDAGAPVRGALITAYLQARGLHPSAQGASDADGRFEITGLDRGSHMLLTRHPDHPADRRGDVSSGRADVEIRLEGGYAIRGQVLDDAGAPVPAFNVVARRASGGLIRRNVQAVSSYDAEGSFEISGLRHGDYELVATSRGFPPSAPVSATASPGGGAQVRLTLRRGGRIEGLVRSASDGRPIAGARVELEGNLGGGGSMAPVLASSISNEEGAFALDGVGDDLRSIRVTAAGHDGRILSGITVGPGATRRMDVDLSPTAEGEEPRMELAGIGVSVFPRDDALVIGNTIEGGGAAAAGLQPGDRILAVDGTPVTDLGFRGSLDRIRGVEGSTVALRVQRANAEEPEDLPIRRTRVRT